MANNYKHYTDRQKEQARNTDIVDILHRQGETVKRAGSEYEWFDNGQKVSIRGNLWFHQYEQTGGNAIDFVQRYMEMSYVEAMEYLVGEAEGAPLKRSEPIAEKEKVPFSLPKKNDNMRRVYAYLLSKRGIDLEVLDTFARRGMIYESEKYHNAVFIGFDKNEKPVHASYRGTGSESTYRGNVPSCTPEYSFHWHGKSDTLYVFEAPIDMLSFISLNKQNWKQHSYSTCCGVSDRCMNQMMKDNPNIRKVKLCLDNDYGGKKATKRISEKLTASGVTHEILVPKRKDWNEDLLCTRDNEQSEEESEEQEEDDEECQELRLLSS